MLTGKENVLKWFDASGKKYWFIYPYGKSDSATYNYHATLDETIDSVRTRQELADALSIMRGRYTIAATTENKRSPRSDWKEDFEMSNSDTSQHPNYMQAVAGIGEDEISNRINAALLKYKTEEELNKVKAENVQLKKDLNAAQKEANEPLNRIAGVAMQYLPMFLGQAQAPTAQVAGLTTDETMEELILTDEENARLSACVDTFNTIAPGEWLPLLEKLAEKLKANPGMLQQLKFML